MGKNLGPDGGYNNIILPLAAVGMNFDLLKFSAILFFIYSIGIFKVDSNYLLWKFYQGIQTTW